VQSNKEAAIQRCWPVNKVPPAKAGIDDVTISHGDVPTWPEVAVQVII